MQNLAQLVQSFLGFLVGTDVLGQGLVGGIQLFVEQFEPKPGLFRIRAVIGFFFRGVVVIV